jgi:cell cycle sensor histidine kinase DivJ
LVKLHGGEMDIHSRLQIGTRVTVRLPIDCESSRPPDPIKLVSMRANELVEAATTQVRKSA